MVSDLTDKMLIKQKQFLWDSVKQQEKTYGETWTEVCGFRVGHLDQKNLRQDEIELGIMPPQSEKELYLSRFSMSVDDQYNILNEHNLKIYLTKCLTFGSLENNRFQQKLKAYFATHKNATYGSAPVKTYDRCVTKSNTDYNGRDFPSVASILDFLRCGVTYDDVNSLLKGLDKFVDDVNAGKLPFFLSILRVKNGFRDTSRWKSMNDANYFDIKFNLLYSSADGQTCQIVEVQFLLKFLMKAKKLGHKFYSIKRRKEFIDSVEHIVYNKNGEENYENFKIKVGQLVRDNNINEFAKHLFVRPHIMTSIILRTPDGCMPLLCAIGWQQRSKLFELFMCHLLYFNDSILLQKEEDKSLRVRYFNYNDGDYPISPAFGKIECQFWGLDATIETNLKLIESLLEMSCFKGFNNGRFENQAVILSCIHKNAYEYLSLRLKYFEKSSRDLTASVRTKNSFTDLLERTDVVSDAWIELIGGVYKKCGARPDKDKLEWKCKSSRDLEQYARHFKVSGGDIY